MKIHPIFHISLLEPYHSNPLPGQQQATEPPPMAIHEETGEMEWEVREILDSRYRYRYLQYLIQWSGYDTPSWEPAEYLENAQDLVEAFHIRYPEKPGPELRRTQ